MKSYKLKNRKLGITLSYINTALNMVCGLVVSSLLLRALGDTEYGLYKTMSSFAGMLVMFEFGTGTVMTRNITLCLAKKTDQGEVKRNVSTIWSITGILTGVIILFSIGFYFSIDNVYSNSLSLNQIQYGKIIFIFAIMHLIVTFFTQTLNGIVLAYEFYSYSSLMSITNVLTRTVLLLLLITRIRLAVVISIIDLIIAVSIFICTIVFCKKQCQIVLSYRFFDKKIFYQVLPLCFAIFLQAIVNQMNNNVDNFLIGVKLNPESVALYSVALYIYTVFSSATTIPISLYAPQIVGDVSKGYKGKQLTETLIQPSRLIVIVGGSILFGFITSGKEFLEIVYGKEYVAAWSIALLLMVPMFVNMSTGVLVNVLDALNKRMARSNVLILTTILNLLLTLVWLDKWGIVGAAVATATSTIIGQIIIMHVYYSKKIGIHVMYLFRKIYSGIVPFQVIAMILAVIVKRFISNVFLSFASSMLIFIIVSLGLYFTLGSNKQEKEMINQIFRKVK